MAHGKELAAEKDAATEDVAWVPVKASCSVAAWCFMNRADHFRAVAGDWGFWGFRKRCACMLGRLVLWKGGGQLACGKRRNVLQADIQNACWKTA